MRFVLASFLCLSAFAASPARLLDTQPVRFERPVEATNVRFLARGAGYAFAFTDDATILRIADRTLHLTLEGSNQTASFEPTQPAPVATNYFTGRQHQS